MHRTARAARCLLTSALALLVAGCAAGAGGGERGRGARGPTPVAAERLAPRDLVRTVAVAGPIEPIRSVAVSAQTAGTVLQVAVEEGSRVTAGQLLAELDARETRAQYERARAVLENAEAAFRRAEQLRAGELASASDLDAARAAYGIARADADLWRTRLEFTRILAPVTGVVTAKRIERGSSVSQHQALFDIADASVLVVRVRISERDVVHIEPGTRAALTLDAHPGVRIDGRVRRVFPSADPDSRLVPVEIELGKLPAGVVARPGYLARAEIALERRDGALTVPASAVGVSDAGSFVYVIEADTLERRPVETGLTSEGRVQIVRGLREGESVVRSGHANLRPGLAVTAVRDAAREAATR